MEGTGLASSGRDEKRVRRFVESFGSALVDAGMPQMPALAFVALLASDEGGLTAEELAAQLQVSRAAISGAVKYLAHVGLITRERQPGSRRHRYVLESPTWYELVSRRERVLDRWIATTREGIDALGPTTPAGERMSESLAFWEFLRDEMRSVMARWQERERKPQRDRRA
jgi:DNA-binding transcriptional regulator GbsR (MarR family)